MIKITTISGRTYYFDNSDYYIRNHIDIQVINLDGDEVTLKTSTIETYREIKETKEEILKMIKCKQYNNALEKNAMNEFLSFDDTLIIPKFSTITSREHVSLSQNLMGETLDLPIISANMDTITGSEMALAMSQSGGRGVLHRFCTIDENVEMFKAGINFKPTNKSPDDWLTIDKIFPWVSVGIGNNEYERAQALVKAGARALVLDVAHGASMPAVRQYDMLRDAFTDEVKIVVGNFATADSVKAFLFHSHTEAPDAIKVGIGGGSMCTTRIVTGCGLPTLDSVQNCASLGIPIIADGGIKNSGDIAKALAAGASLVMVGSLLSGTRETPGEVYDDLGIVNLDKKEGRKGPLVKKYRGSASQESYEAQGKVANHRTAEGESTLVPYKGPVEPILQSLSAGLKSAFTYVGASDMLTFKSNAELARITNSGMIESRSHGKKT